MNDAESRAGLPATAGSRYVQAARCLANLGLVLSVHGFARDDIRRLVVYVVGDHPALSEAWRAVTEWFAGPVPPATLLGVARLGYRGQLVELDATVIRAAGAE